MFGGVKAPASSVPNKALTMRVTNSAIGQVRPVIIGTQRVAGRMIDYEDFLAIPHTSSQKQGGKGGGGGGTTSTTSYTYQAAMMLALCEGQISGIGKIWDTRGQFALNTAVETYTVAGPGTYTVAHGANFYADIGCTRADSYSVTTNDYGSDGSVTHSGTQQTPMLVTGLTPTAGQYKVNTLTGQYTFSAADIGKQMSISYVYSVPDSNSNGIPVAKLNLTTFTGARPQSVWSYMTTNHPTKALAYSGLAYIATAAMDLGSSATVPNISFEVMGLGLFGGGVLDADPTVALSMILTDPNWSCQFPSAQLGVMTAMQNYCLAQGLLISPLLDTQQTAATIVKDICDAMNTAPVWSNGQLKFIPYGEQTLVGNGKTYIPNTSPIYDLSSDDFIASAGSDDLVQIDIASPADAYNQVAIEWLNRANDYNTEITQAQDDWSISQTGLRSESPRAYHFCTTGTVAATISSLVLKRSVYYRNKYSFTISALRYSLLEPMDIVTLTEPNCGLSFAPVRITLISEDQNFNLKIEAEDFLFGTATATLYSKQTGVPTVRQANADPGSVNAPVIFEPPHRLTQNSSNEVWLAVSGQDLTDWGGANVWVSTDNTNYVLIGAVNAPARMGVTSALLPTSLDPDTTDVLGVDLSMSGGAMLSGNQGDADNFRTLCALIDSFNGNEFVSYQTAALTLGSKYNLTYLRRGLFGTNAVAHVKGVSFVRCDDAVFVWDYDPTLVGKPVWFKFTSFNNYNLQQQSLANVTAYPYTIQGTSVISGTEYLDLLVHKGTASGAGQFSDAKFISSLSYTIVSGDVLEYDVFGDPSCPEFKFALDFLYNGGANRFTGAVINDQNGVANALTTDLSAQCNGQWYRRRFSLTSLAGQTITAVASCIHGNVAGTFKVAWAKAYITNAGVVNKTIFQAGEALNLGTFVASDTYTGVLFYSSHVYPKGWDILSSGSGSIPPTFTGGFTWTLTTTSITISWSGIQIYRADGSVTNVPNGSYAITSLTASTLYYLYPYWDEVTQTLVFVTGVTGHTSVGSPSYCFTTNALWMSQQQQLTNRVPLSSVPIQISTPASGTGGGGGGGSGQCVWEYTLVETRERGVIFARDVQIGEHLSSRSGWLRVEAVKMLPQEVFVRVECAAINEAVVVSPTHPFTTHDEKLVRASELTLSHLLHWREGIVAPSSISIVRHDRGMKIAITVEEPHEFFAGEKQPLLLVHNYANPS